MNDSCTHHLSTRVRVQHWLPFQFLFICSASQVLRELRRMFSMARRGVLTITTHRKRVGITRRIPMTRLSFIGITSLCLTTALAQTGRFGVVSGQEVVQDVPTRTTDHDISLVGINKFRKACSETNEMDCTTSAYVLAALEIDEYLTGACTRSKQMPCKRRM